MTTRADDQLTSPVWNVPNRLTAARLVLALVVFVLIPCRQYLAALVVFVLAVSTDWVDGWWARRYGQVTKLGRILDPFVDKVIICGSFILLAVEMRGAKVSLPWYALIAGWMAVVVVGREMLVTGLRGFIEQSGGDFSARFSGKLKMVLQCLAVAAALLALRYDEVPPTWLVWTLVLSVWLAVLSTVYSGVGYVIAAARFMRQ